MNNNKPASFMKLRRKSLDDIPKFYILAKLRKVRRHLYKIAARERVYVRRLESERNFLMANCKRASQKLRSLKVCAKFEMNELKMVIKRMKIELDTSKFLLSSRENEIEKLLKENTFLQQQQILKSNLPVNNPPPDQSESSEETIKRLKIELMTFKQATELAVPMLKELRDSLNLKQLKEDMLTQECFRLRACIDEMMMLNAINNSSDKNSNASVSGGIDLFDGRISTDGAI